MSDPTRRRSALRDWIRIILGPVSLLVCAAWQGVRITGPVTVALAGSPPPVTLVAGDLLAVLALTSVVLFGASALAGRRVLIGRIVGVVAASQLPMALVAILAGKNILGDTVAQAIKSHQKELLTHPWGLVSPLILPAVLALILTALAVTLLYRGYARVTQATGHRLLLSFAGGLIGAELLCRIWSHFAG